GANASAAPPAGFGWPLEPRPAVVRGFDKPPHDWLPGHRGVDLAGADGQPVLAAGAGIVVFAGEVGGKPVVSVDHPGGLRTTYEPVRAGVPVGRRVERGAVLGMLQSGHAGCPGVCLHWGLRRGRDYLDPLGLVRHAPVRLKPVRPPAPSEAAEGRQRPAPI
ncbi:M23 family peptidase, partial [Nocardia nova]|uniref:M23 family metallopeptidase n=1 Tax=Nocardia nova TaxID=37330 RepID=UPI0025AF7C5E